MPVPDTSISSASRQTSAASDSTRSRSNRGQHRPRGPSPAPAAADNIVPPVKPLVKPGGGTRERSRSRDGPD
eukprot:6159075-Pyramimonas_sp.AAC.1